jgi:sterol desaturase/sphingolipid hydroxylase (fatty acid hydroxylase superfamily)
MDGLLPDGWQRTAIVAAVAVALLAAEALWAARPAVRGGRWATNLGLGFANLVLGFALSAIAAIAAAHWAAANGVGLFHWLALPGWLAIPLAVALLDMAVYWQHRILHMHPLLWRLHRTHHRDEAMDLTTGVRFHPGEIVVSGLWKAAVVIMLGADPAAVVVFETILTAASLWEHANIRLSERTDRRLRHLLVTPAMHLIHHGRDGDDMRTNFGFSTSLWDRLFNSYREQATSTRLGAE